MMNRDRLKDLVVYIDTRYAKVDLRTSQALVSGRTWQGDYVQGSATVTVLER